MVPSPKLSFIANDSNPTSVGLALDSTIHFGGLEFIADCFGHPSLFPQVRDSSAMFVGMVNSGPPSRCTPLEESSGEDGATSSVGGAWDPPTPEDAMWQTR
jgi:hypothetical protein